MEDLQAQIEAEWQAIKDGDLKLPAVDIAAIETYFAAPNLAERAEGHGLVAQARKADEAFASWLSRNVTAHKNPD